MHLPTLETKRLRIRPLRMEDLDDCHRLYVDIGWADQAVGEDENLKRRREWLEWTVRNYEQLARLYQPPYGERAVELEESGQFVGLVGLVPLLAPFGQLPSFGRVEGARFSAEVGLFWATAPAWQRRGYATEAARALVAHAFDHLKLGRILAGTQRDNTASLDVMRRLGMRIEENPFPEPPWFEVTGILEAASW
ncbi:acetyltransferase, GNAT family [Cystobacter fuscus DSM 2262]|uniref:Acetyltransferase, GNAT family n=1 Tax=Cystobacter fuscus (strain ATCC 25194 / DSM 2262 / NBRC 100088 / M29) TaxID=1242864 RepID=S9PMW9_CYSF2|nr:GNAT family N-acetyltransferase [Cystobacter fuscus]EPX64376.1 acetyltransferase, GNAT family [Cystobacter fuscus DSM 2262]